MKKALLILFSCCFGFAAFSQEIFDMPFATATYVTGINDSGEICGYYTLSGGTTFGFEIDKYGDTIIFNYLGNNNYTTANGISNSGMIVGDYRISGSNPQDDQSYIFFPLAGRNMGGTYTNISAAWGGTYNTCSGILDDTCIAGSFHNGNNSDGVLWCNSYSVETDLRCNNQGTVITTYGTCVDKYSNVGGYIIEGANVQCAIYRGGVWDTFAVGGSIKSHIYGMNDNGWICGNYNSQTKGYMCRKQGIAAYTNFMQVGVGGAVTIYPMDINNNNEVVGYYFDANGVAHGFIFAKYDIGYLPSRDGYNILNGKTFPFGYWSGTSYATDPYLADGSSFLHTASGKNFPSSCYPTWPDFVNAIGESEFYDIIGGKRVLKPSSCFKWSVDKGKFGGSCLGMALTSILAFDTLNGYLGRWPSAASFATPHMFNYPSNDSTLSPMHQAWSMQLSKEFTDNRTLHEKDTVGATMQTLKQNMRNSRGKPHVFLCLEIQHGSGAHALLPFRISPVMGQVGLDSVFVYDCNFPGYDTLCILVNEQRGTGPGTWHYTANGNLKYRDQFGNILGIRDWGAPIDGRGLTVPPIDTWFINQHMHLKMPPSAQPPLITRSQTGVTSSYNDSSLVTMVDDNSNTAWFSADSTAGTTLLYPLHQYSGADTIEPTSVFSNSLLTAVHKTALSDSNDNFLSIRDNKYFIQCSRIGGTGANDDYIFSPSSLTYLDNDTGSRNVSFVVTNTDSLLEYDYFISGLTVQPGKKITTSTYADSGMTIQNYGPGSNYIVTTYFITDSLHMFTDTLHIDSNTTHTFLPHDTTHSGIYILVDKGMDGTTDDTIFINQTPTGINRITAPNVTAWPVPSGNELYMSGPKGLISYIIVDVLGRTAATGEIDFGNGITQKFDLTNLPPGIYIVRGNGKEEKWSYMFVKQ